MGIQKTKSKNLYNLESSPIDNMNKGINNVSNESLVQAIQELSSVINNQGKILRDFGKKQNELSFKISKIEEQLQIQRVANRMTRDRMNSAILTMMELGILDKDIFNVAYSIQERKILPITSDGDFNVGLSLTRYNPPENMPSPKEMTE